MTVVYCEKAASLADILEDTAGVLALLFFGAGTHE
jgi:hypothetical protein